MRKKSNNKRKTSIKRSLKPMSKRKSSVKRRSPKLKRKSIKRRSPKLKRSKRKSIKRRSPQLRSQTAGGFIEYIKDARDDGMSWFDIKDEMLMRYKLRNFNED